MNVIDLVSILEEQKINFFTGVPDSLLSDLSNYLISQHGCTKNHIIAHNEGGCVGLASGYHLSTGKTPCVYLQNSGIGNIMNPAISLTHSKVYAIPILYIVGWRGEPGKKDEPQHVYQGEVSQQQLESAGITTKILTSETTINMLQEWLNEFESLFKEGKSAAFLVQKGAIFSDNKIKYKNDYVLSREDAIKTALSYTHNDIIVSTTGKASREIFEAREELGLAHKNDFLTVGSMGHSSMIALGIATNKKNKKVWCFDGDGSALMHMGALGTVGNISPSNYTHIIFNNLAHESVGGAPTCSTNVNFTLIAKACGYKYTYSAKDKSEFEQALSDAKNKEGPILIEVFVSIGAREDLGRPTITPIENKIGFMRFLEGN